MNQNFGTLRPRTNPDVAQIMNMQKETSRLIFELGGLAMAARILGVKYYTLSGWRTRGRVPAAAANEICRLDAVKKKGFTRESLRPDILCWWGE